MMTDTLVVAMQADRHACRGQSVSGQRKANLSMNLDNVNVYHES
jgi:hypothetical protein